MHTNLPATNTCPLMRASFFSTPLKSWATHLMSFRNSPTTTLSHLPPGNGKSKVRSHISQVRKLLQMHAKLERF